MFDPSFEQRDEVYSNRPVAAALEPLPPIGISPSEVRARPARAHASPQPHRALARS